MSNNESKKLIYLIEDDNLLSEMYAMVLRDEGFDVDIIRDGASAIARELNNVDLVLLDIRLPEVDGLEVLKNYRSRNYKGKVIVLTNNPQIDSVEAKKSGADDFLIKSHTDIGEVLAIVKKHLSV